MTAAERTGKIEAIMKKAHDEIISIEKETVTAAVAPKPVAARNPAKQSKPAKQPKPATKSRR